MKKSNGYYLSIWFMAACSITWSGCQEDSLNQDVCNNYVLTDGFLDKEIGRIHYYKGA